MKSKDEFFKEYEQERTKTQVWSRVMGYMRNVASFNVGKQSEFKQRKFFDIKHQIAEMTK